MLVPSERDGGKGGMAAKERTRDRGVKERDWDSEAFMSKTCSALKVDKEKLKSYP